MYLKQIFLLSCLTVSSFATQSSNAVSSQSYRKIDFPLQVWNLFSPDKTEGVTIISNSLSSGSIRCGVACQQDPECGGFLFDKTSGSCTMKSVKNILESNKLFLNTTDLKFRCLPYLKTPSEAHDSVAIFVKTEKLACFIIHKRGFNEGEGINENFTRTWDEYKNGFGDHDKEFWLGNDQIHLLTRSGDSRLRLEFEDWDGNTAWAEYDTFRWVM